MSDRESGGSDPEAPTDAGATEASEWRFTLEDIEAREDEAAAAEEAARERREPIAPGTPTLEGTLFVLLGVAFTLFVFSRLLLG